MNIAFSPEVRRDQAWALLENLPLVYVRGIITLAFFVLFLILLYRGFRLEHKFLFKLTHKFSVIFEIFFEKIFEFFSEILGEGQKYWVKSFVIGVFFIVLISNLMGTVVDFLAMMFPWVEERIIAPTTNRDFNIAIAIVSVGMMLFLQLQKLGVGKFIYAYIPFRWKGVLQVERGNMSAFFYYPLRLVAKLFDIVVSIFVGLLDVIGVLAKVVSLSFRLTGNMMSGTILLGMLVIGMKGLTAWRFGFEIPAVFPLIVILQGVFIGAIQAFVFALLTAISIKVVTEDS